MNVFKNIIVSVVVLIATTDIVLAQSYNIIPNDTVEVIGNFEDLETLVISQLNTSSDSIQLKWQQVNTSVPLNWEATICDNSLCNTSLVDTGTMNPVYPAETGFLLVHLTAHINEGTAVIRYAVWDTNFPSNRDTLTFIMKVYHPSSIKENFYEHKIRIAPNPANQMITISAETLTGFEIQIQDINGKRIYQGTSTSSSFNLSTDSFQSGNYYLTTIVHNQRITQKIFIHH